MSSIFGKTQGLKASQLRRLEKLAQRSASSTTACTPELARALADCATDTGRMVGVLCDRRGRVEHTAIGEPHRLYLPEIGRLRAGPGRLRGLRLVVAKPHVRTAPREPLPVDGDLVTDLERLQLDAVVVVEALPDNLPGRCALALLAPAQPGDDDDAPAPRHAVEHMPHVQALGDDFAARIADLEAALAQGNTRARAAAHVAGEREVAVLVGVTTGPRVIAESSMDELEELARTAGVRVAERIVQVRKEIDPRTIVGSGKLEEICLAALHKGAEMIIFDRDLSPSQLNQITDLTDLKVLDRTMLILDIFAHRAKSKGGKLQVELAQLRYSLPRLAKKQSGLSRLTGGIGGQGPGETKLEIDRRRAKDKITKLERDLEDFSQERQLRRSVRNERGVPVIALVGYTNAGKSTLLNRLTNSDVYVADELFATLDTTSRRLRFPDEREVILIDTVGFIRDLPDTLVQAFRATLEELHEADLLLHVVDGADPKRAHQMDAVDDVIDGLGLSATPRIRVLNKSDRLTGKRAVVAGADGGDGEARRLDAVRVSATSGAGLDALVQRILQAWPEKRQLEHAQAQSAQAKRQARYTPGP